MQFRFIILIKLVCIILLSSCRDKNDCYDLITGWEPIPPSPYDSPVWHPGGDIIGFNHIPLKEKKLNYPNGIECPGYASYSFDYDSIGFWLINPDGTNMHRVLPFTLQTPDWSPNGDWIVFGIGATIYKMHFSGNSFDTTSITQLTSNDVRCFSPSWSPDGNRIVYATSICNGPNTCGVWLMNVNNLEKTFIASYGSFPEWHPNGDKILYSKRIIAENGASLGDSLFYYDLNTNTEYGFTSLKEHNWDNRYFKFSPTSDLIAFTSQSSFQGEGITIWIMDPDGANLKQLTTKTSDTPNWSPNGKNIVYLRFNLRSIDEKEGTLWIMDDAGSNKWQLTFNQFITSSGN